jgi:hypothetical protein
LIKLGLSFLLDFSKRTNEKNGFNFDQTSRSISSKVSAKEKKIPKKKKEDQRKFLEQIFEKSSFLRMSDQCEEVIVPGQGIRRVKILDLQVAIGFSGR